MSDSMRRVLIATLTAPDDCIRGITQFARENNWLLVTDMMLTGVVPRKWKGDGILALLPYQPELLEQVRQLGTACIAFTDSEQSDAVSRVETDNAEIGRLAADHFVARAHRSFAWAPFLDDGANRQRHVAFRARLAEHGFDCRSLTPSHLHRGLQWQDNWAEHRRGLIDELQRLPRPTALFAYNDWVAVRIVHACRDAGLSVPEDIAVLGVGNSMPCESSPVPLSSIDLDLQQTGYRAAAALEEIMNGYDSPRIVRALPKGVVTRVSTDITAVTNPRVARALAYIAENYSNPLLGVGDIAEAAGTSRRNLERSFRLETGFTIHEHIVRNRMQEASRLLKTHPRAKTSEIASLVGLAEPGTFFRTFRRFFGMSPKAHRDWSTQAENVSRLSTAPPEAQANSSRAPHAPAAGVSPTAA